MIRLDRHMGRLMDEDRDMGKLMDEDGEKGMDKELGN